MGRIVIGAGDAARVIIADDDADIRELVAIAVRKSGLQLVGSLDDGDAAWEAIQHELPCLVVLDVSMPGKTGVEICRLIRGEPRTEGTCVILLSAGVDDVSREIGLEAGADAYLDKPFSPRDLVDQLSALAPRTAVRL